GAATALSSIIFAVKARSAADDVSGAKGAWSQELDQRVQDGHDADRNFKVVLATGGGIMIAGAVTYLIGVLTGEHEELVPPTAGPATPTVGPDGVGIAVGGGF